MTEKSPLVLKNIVNHLLTEHQPQDVNIFFYPEISVSIGIFFVSFN